MTLQRISAADAKSLIDKGAVLVDVREDSERRESFIPGSVSLPLSRLAPIAAEARGADTIIFHCKSGMRTTANAAALADVAGCTAYVLDGGLNAWTAAGLPVASGAVASGPVASGPVASTPRDTDGLMRQAQVMVGLLVLLGVGLGTLLSPVWLALPAALAVVLLLTGGANWNGLARLVAVLPWNR